jgi:hypothetical protein
MEQGMSALQELGFTKEELEQKVIQKIADDLLLEYGYESETGADTVDDSHLKRKFHEIIKKHVDRQINKMAEEYVVPHVREIIESVSLQQTNQWGEKKGEDKTFKEYLTESAQAYLSQPVDFQGDASSSYSQKNQTRLVHLVHQHLHYAIESAMKDAVDQVKKQIGPALEATVKLKLGEIANSLKVQLATK